MHVVHLINRVPSPVISNKCPYEKLYTIAPDISNLRIFGCLCFASTLENNRNKLDPRTKRCIFLGFKAGTKGYIVFDAQTREIFVSRNVLFYEKSFCQVTDKSERNELNYDQSFMEYMYDSPHDNYHRGSMNEVANTENRDFRDLRRSTRSRRSPAYLEDYHHQLLTSSEKVINIGTTRYALNSILSNKNLSDEHFNYSISLFFKLNHIPMRKLLNMINGRQP